MQQYQHVPRSLPADYPTVSHIVSEIEATLRDTSRCGRPYALCPWLIQVSTPDSSCDLRRCLRSIEGLRVRYTFIDITGKTSIALEEELDRVLRIAAPADDNDSRRHNTGPEVIDLTGDDEYHKVLLYVSLPRGGIHDNSSNVSKYTWLSRILPSTSHQTVAWILDAPASTTGWDVMNSAGRLQQHIHGTTKHGKDIAFCSPALKKLYEDTPSSSSLQEGYASALQKYLVKQDNRPSPSPTTRPTTTTSNRHRDPRLGPPLQTGGGSRSRGIDSHIEWDIRGLSRHINRHGSKVEISVRNNNNFTATLRLRLILCALKRNRHRQTMRGIACVRRSANDTTRMRGARIETLSHFCRTWHQDLVCRTGGSQVWVSFTQWLRDNGVGRSV